MARMSCECGCGQETKPAPQTWAKQGWVKGQPLRFVVGHSTRGRVLGPRPDAVKEKIRAKNIGRPPDPSSYAHWAGADTSGPRNANWKGGQHVFPNGYRGLCVPGHRRAYSNGYVYEHIVVAEAKIGRPLAKGEVVHHLDHDRLNNDPGNLVVVASHSEHIRLYHPNGRHRKSMPRDS